MPLQEVRKGDDRALQDIADLVTNSHKIVIITGAGISTSCGIPDFRSKDGLYNLIPDQSLQTPTSSAPSTPSKKRKLSVFDEDGIPCSSQSSVSSTSSQRTSPISRLRGQDLFDARVWKDPASTEVFYQFIASLRRKIQEDVAETSLTHKFIRTLRDGGRLMRCYTQNIDGLEAREGLCTDMKNGKGNKKRFLRKNFQAPRPPHTQNTEFDGGCEVVPLHGDLDTVRCSLCQVVREWDEVATESFLDGQAPGCEQCSKKNADREARGKRGVSVGLLRPNIVLYGEEHPSNQLLAPLVPFDLSSNPEVLIIMGTSLKVFGLQKVVRDFAKNIHSRKDGKGRVVFVNRTKPAESVWEDVIDEYVAMDCDDWVRDLRTRRDDLWLRQGELNLKATKPAVKRKNKDGENNNRPTKKAKQVTETMVSVDIPNPQRLTPVVPTLQGLPTPPPSRGSLEKIKNILGSDPSTPQRPRTWKTNMYTNPLAAMLSPQRPAYSPLRKSFKAPKPGPDMPRSPERPEYSPMNSQLKSRKRVEVYADAEGELSEYVGYGADRDTDGDTIEVYTPIKSKSRHPLSDSSANSERVMDWVAKAAKDNSVRGFQKQEVAIPMKWGT